MAPTSPAAESAVVRLESPYRGIEEFRYIDEPIFFGRDADARDLLRLITMYRGVLVYGDSGVGKSSLLNAKLMPRAVLGGYAPERVRVQPKPGEEFIIERVAEDLPTIFPGGADLPRISLSAAEFMRRASGVCSSAERGRMAGRYPLLIFDQFEELVTLTEELPRHARAVAREAARAIEDTLLELLRDPDLCVKVVLVFREDYYSKLSRFFSRHPNLTDHALRIEPLHVDQLHAIIRGPFEVPGVAFEHELPLEVAQQLEEEFKSRSDSDLINLTEVQIAAQRLWQHEQPDVLLREQHVDGLLQSYFTEAIGTLEPRLREPAVTILGRMVTSSGTRNVVSVDDLLATAREEGISGDIAERTLLDLEKRARVIRRERRNDVVVYEIVSEYLVPWIRWKKAEAQAEKRRHEIEEQRERTRRRVRLAAAILCAVAFVGMLIEIYRRSSTELARELSRTEEQNDVLLDRLEAEKSTVLRLERELARFRAANATERRLREQATAAAQVATQLRVQAEETRDWAIRFRNDSKAYAAVLEAQRDALVQKVAPASDEGVPVALHDAIVRTARSEEFDRAVRNYLKDLDALAKQLEDAQVRIKALEKELRDAQEKIRTLERQRTGGSAG